MKAAVLEQIGKPLRLIDLEMPSFGGEVIDVEKMVRIKMLTAGICGAQLQEIDGKKGNLAHLPHLLGHEGCGTIDGTNQKVVVHWKKGEGEDEDVSSVDVFGDVKAGPCTTFSTYTYVARNRTTPIPSDVPSDLACLLGCCLSTALATVENVARVKTNESVLIVGVGGVGLAMILAAKLAGATRIVGTDESGLKRKLAYDMGVTGFVDSYMEDYYFGPERFDVIIDTAGVITRANLLARGGRYIMVGQPLPEMTLQPFTAGWIFQGNGGRVEATNGGGFNPTKDIPRYVEMWRDGKLDDYKKIITHRIKLDEINQGISLMRDGKAGRVLIEM
jgi:Zn-dependent alcohol dehydrogenase